MGGVIGCKQFSWLGGVGCGLSSAFECVGPGCGRCGAGVWVVPGAHHQDARPVPVGDQERDQAQRRRRRVLQGRGGGRMAARRRALPKERALDAAPVLRARAWSGLARGRTPRQISGRLKARSAWRGWGTMCGLLSSRWAHDQPRGDLHVDPHAIAEEGPRRARDRAGLTAVGRAKVGTPPVGCEPPGSWACD